MSCQCEECLKCCKWHEHKSSCAVHNEPALSKGKCNCRSCQTLEDFKKRYCDRVERLNEDNEPICNDDDKVCGYYERYYLKGYYFDCELIC